MKHCFHKMPIVFREKIDKACMFFLYRLLKFTCRTLGFFCIHKIQGLLFLNLKCYILFNLNKYNFRFPKISFQKNYIINNNKILEHFLFCRSLEQPY